jgi:3-phosphoshikimate 1-carboxyvinyltransferase
VTQQRLQIRPVGRLRGTVRVPGDKSISHRYAMLAAIAAGTTEITHLAPGADVRSTLSCLAALGAEVEWRAEGQLRVGGLGRPGFRAPAAALDAGNSGTTMRLLAGLLAGFPLRARLEGDASLSRRPMRRVIEPLAAMGARIGSADGRPPLEVDGGALTAIRWASRVASAQVKSAILLAGLRATGTTVVVEALATRDHTERALPAFGGACETNGLTVSVSGGQALVAPQGILGVPGDPSSAAVWACAAAALPGSAVVLDQVGLNPYRLGFLAALSRMGATVERREDALLTGEPVGQLRIGHGTHQATTIGAEEVPSLIDELPVLAARAALGGGLEVHGAGELRVKESDRITALVTGFRALGVSARELPDGFVIDGGRPPTGGTADAAGDHRLVMAFALVGLGASRPTTITDAGVVGVSYPTFERDLALLVG